MRGVDGVATSLEERVRTLGRQLLADAAQAHTRADRFAQDERLLLRLMSDEAVRTQVLRFVDVLPSLRTDAQVVEHVIDYVGPHLGQLPLPVVARFARQIEWGLAHARHGLPAKLVATATRAMAGRIAKRFIAGHDIASVTRNLHRLHKRGMGFTLDLLGEAAVSEAEAQAYQRRYLDLIERLTPRVERWPRRDLLDHVSGRRSPRLNLSVKISSLYSQLDAVAPDAAVAAIAARLRPILLAARAAGAFITLDMEAYDTMEVTLRLFRELLTEPALRDWPDVGIAVQAYLRDTDADLPALIDWAKQRGTPVTVRLVRGAYWDFETVIARQQGWPIPVWTRKAETDACYERNLARLLAAYPQVETAVATHNVRSLAAAMALARQCGLEPSQYEVQMLYGMADDLKHAVVAMGERLRVYAPFGELIPGMAYLVRRLLENTSSQSFVRLGFAEALPAEELLAPPVVENGDEVVAMNEGYRPEPVRRFTDAAERAGLAAALRRVREGMGGTREGLVSVNPARVREVVGVFTAAGAEEVERAVAGCAKPQAAWGVASWEERAGVLRRAAAVMRGRRDTLAAWEILEAGKPWREADADVAEAISFLEYYAQEAERLGQSYDLSAPGEDNRYFYQPRGVAAVISPWNFPLAIPTGMVAAALVTGNAVMFKPAPQTPMVAAKLVEVFAEAGLPPGLLHFLPGGDEAGAALVAHPGVHVIAFTGSEAVGKKIIAAAAEVREGQRHIKRVIAEMGGKNAIIVDADADVDDAVRGIVHSAFGYAGQKCSAASRAIVVGDLYEPLLARLAEAVGSLTVGDPSDPNVVVGPVIDEEARRRLRNAIEEASSRCRKIVSVDVSHLGDGYFVGPAVFADVNPDDPLAQNELFGPVLAVMRAATFEQALDIANDTRYALTGGVFSRSPRHLELARRTFRVGNLYLNRGITGAVVGRQPFGGFQLSGVGSKAGGPDYLLQFVEPRTITENTIRRGFAPE